MRVIGNAGQLVGYARNCLRLPTTYLWDTMGEIVCPGLLAEKAALWPEKYLPELCWEKEKLTGKGVRAFDCSGLIKRFLMGGFSRFHYDPSLDYNSLTLLENAPVQGEGTELPEVPGLCLYLPGHVGIYAGCGRVIEATANPRFGDGVVETAFADREWTQWFTCPHVHYP